MRQLKALWVFCFYLNHTGTLSKYAQLLALANKETNWPVKNVTVDQVMQEITAQSRCRFQTSETTSSKTLLNNSHTCFNSLG